MDARGSLAALLSATMLMVGAACGGDETGPSREPTAPGDVAATGTPETSATPADTPPDGEGPRSLSILAPIPLPDRLVLYLERGCYGCDGGPTSIERVYRAPDGELRWDTVFESDAGRGPILAGPVVADDGTMYITTCSTGYCGFLEEPSEDARSTLFRSLDGGITWEELDTFDGPSAVALVAGDALILNNSTFDAGGSGEWIRRFVSYPNGQALETPPGFEDQFITPIWLDGRLSWHDSATSTIVDGEGNLLWDLAAIAGVDPTTHRVRILSLPTAGDAIMSVVESDGDGDSYYLVIHDNEVSAGIVVEGSFAGLGLSHTTVHTESATGNLFIALEQLEAAFESSGADYELADETYGRDYQHSLPTLFDLWGATAQPIELFGQLINTEYATNRNLVVHALQNDFMRVDTGDADCLNVRQEPRMDAPVVSCYTDGVLLMDVGATEESDGTTWLRLRTPTGEMGWATAEYLLH